MIAYEWVIELVDGHEDVIDLTHADRYADAVSIAAQLAAQSGTAGRVDIGLVRDRFNDIDGALRDRQWAYLENGKLPPHFDGGAKVPAKFCREVGQ